MPRYKKKKINYKGFHNAKHILQYLGRAQDNSPDWKYFKNAAKNHKAEDLFLRPETLRKIQSGRPRDLQRDVIWNTGLSSTCNNRFGMMSKKLCRQS